MPAGTTGDGQLAKGWRRQEQHRQVVIRHFADAAQRLQPVVGNQQLAKACFEAPLPDQFEPPVTG